MISFTVSSFPTVVIWMINSVGSGRNVCLPVRASAQRSRHDHRHTQDGGEPGDEDQRRHAITVLARGSLLCLTADTIGRSRPSRSAQSQERFEILREARSSERTQIQRAVLRVPHGLRALCHEREHPLGVDPYGDRDSAQLVEERDLRGIAEVVRVLVELGFSEGNPIDRASEPGVQPLGDVA